MKRVELRLTDDPSSFEKDGSLYIGSDIYSEPADWPKRRIARLLDSLTPDGAEAYDTQHENLQADFERLDLQGAADLESVLALVRRLILVYRRRMRRKRIPGSGRPFEDFEHTIPPIELDGGCYCRTGIVELRVLYSYLADLPGFCSAADRLISSRRTPVRRPRAGDQSIHAADPLFNISRLMRNAGFYFDRRAPRAWRDMIEWCNLYISGLRSSTGLFRCAQVSPMYLQVGAMLGHRRSHFVRRPFMEDLMRQFAGKRIVMVSAYASQLEALHRSGRVYRLYEHFEAEPFELRAIQAPMSIYPNRPHDSWKDSFDRIREAVNQEISEHGADLFIPSCGSYGLPLAWQVWQDQGRGLSCWHFGHVPNSWFGILTTSSEGIAGRREENWERGRIDAPGVGGVDKGRYV